MLAAGTGWKLFDFFFFFFLGGGGGGGGIFYHFNGVLPGNETVTFCHFSVTYNVSFNKIICIVCMPCRLNVFFFLVQMFYNPIG